jgi:hypothetical protein
MALMAMIDGPPRKFKTVEGGRRMLGEKTPRPALDLKIIKGEKSWSS